MSIDGDYMCMGQRSGARAILEGPNDLVMSYALRFNFSISYNMVKYGALINGMQLALEIKVDDLKVLATRSQ